MGKYDFKFGDYWASELGAVSTKTPGIEIAQRDFDMVQIPGRDGDDYIDNGRYENVNITRSISFIGYQYLSVKDKTANFINTFAYLQGYQTFEDTDHDELVTEAVLTNFNEISRKLRTLNTATLKFSRKPFWFLKNSLEPQSADLTAETVSMSFHNPFHIDSKPIIRFALKTKSSGTDTIAYDVTTGGVTTHYSHQVNRATYSGSYVFEIDCESQIVRMIPSGSSTIKYPNYTILAGFDVGTTTVELTGTTKSSLNSLTITPRWRCL